MASPPSAHSCLVPSPGCHMEVAWAQGGPLHRRCGLPAVRQPLASQLFSFLATPGHPAGQWPSKGQLGDVEKVSVPRKRVTEELILVTAGRTRGRERRAARPSGSGVCTGARGSAGRLCACSSGEVHGDGLEADVTWVTPPARCPHLEAVTHREGKPRGPLESQRRGQNSPVPGLSIMGQQ